MAVSFCGSTLLKADSRAAVNLGREPLAIGLRKSLIAAFLPLHDWAERWAEGMAER